MRAPIGGPKQHAWDLLRDRNFRNLLLVNWLQSACWDVHTFVLPLLGHEKGLSASVIGTLLGILPWRPPPSAWPCRWWPSACAKAP